MCWPVSGVQIVGTAQRDVSRRKKKKRWGEKGGENKGTPFPPLSLSLSLSSFLFFPHSLTSRRAPLSERLEQVTTVPVPEHKVEPFVLVHNSEHRVPVYIPFSSVLRHSTALCSLLSSCFKMAPHRATWSNYVQTEHSHISVAQGVN